MKRMTTKQKRQAMYAGAIGLIVLFLLLILILGRGGNEDITTKKTEMGAQTSTTYYSSSTQSEAYVEDNRTAKEVATDFVYKLYTFDKKSLEGAKKDADSSLSKALDNEFKGNSKQEVKNVSVTSYEPVEESKHIIVSFETEKGAKKEQHSIFLVVQELNGGFKVTQYQTDATAHSDE